MCFPPFPTKKTSEALRLCGKVVLCYLCHLRTFGNPFATYVIMETRNIGSLEVSVVGLGCNNFGKRVDYEGTVAVIDAAIDAGINFFDTADVYGGTKSEEFVGKALRSRRKDVFIATKFGSRIDSTRKGAKADYVARACEDSLKRLGTDYIDLYQLHRPDPSTPIEETLGALDRLVKAGKVREIGCSNFSAAELREAHSVAKRGAARFVSVQNEYSLLHREPETEVLGQCQRLNIAFIPYFPLVSGLLTGKYRRGQEAPKNSRLTTGWLDKDFTNENLDVVESLIDFAESQGHTILELAVSWLLSHEVVASVIAGATKPEQVKANAAAGSWSLSDEELVRVDQILGSVMLS